MFTQCAKCETVFRLSAETLRAAGGQVRCGRCGEVFNALARLAEEASAFPAGESPLEMEERADEILHSSMAPAVDRNDRPEAESDDLNAIDVDFARLQVVEKFQEDLAPPIPHETPTPAKPPNTAPAAKSAEAAKTAPAPKATPTPTPKIATAAKMTTPAKAAPPTKEAAPMKGTDPVKINPPAKTTAPPTTKPSAQERPAEEGGGVGSMEYTLPPGELDRIFVEPLHRGRQSTLAAGNTQSQGDGSIVPENLFGESAESANNPVSGMEVSEDTRREMLSGINEPSFDDVAPAGPASPLPFAAWLCAAILLALALAAQMIHENREWFAAHAPMRGPLRGAYAALGVTVQVPANLAAYQLRQWGVTGDTAAAGTLRVRASILNTAAQLQPYPLLRVTLANRFGTRIGARDFEPAEYLGKPTVRMLAPGERADATLDILDPGKDAEGFEIDVCLRGVDLKVACAGDVAARTKQ